MNKTDDMLPGPKPSCVVLARRLASDRLRRIKQKQILMTTVGVEKTGRRFVVGFRGSPHVLCALKQ